MTTTLTLPVSQPARPSHAVVSSAVSPVKRVNSTGLMEGGRELEIEHAGRVYRLRVTQLNKLILTA
ncbi:hemin uptake protein HemP [Oxalobacteraceae bacterium OTU3REALA1]|jgi:hemin uptake protein HemP|nr:hemin uptake protein HemP [uncultured Duganella sp.]USX22402.1 hemin uptake protein HemP [Oxalobacteraceae bacterium OTU3REALA1]